MALIGASRDHEKIPGRLLAMLRKNGYPGQLYPINPNYDEIDGLRCHKSIADVGAPIDLAVIVIPARAVLSALEQCAAAGVKNAVIISSGFAEEGGDSAAMQDAIVALAKRTGMRISGPNAEGFYSQVQKVAATFSPTVDVKPDAPVLVASTRRIGIVAQSGGIGFAIYHRAKALGIALSYVVSAGNESDLGAGEFLDYMVQDRAGSVHRRDPAVHRRHPRRRQVLVCSGARRRDQEAGHRDQGRPLRRRRACRRFAHRQYGRLVSGL
jgi:acetyltransferase